MVVKWFNQKLWAKMPVHLNPSPSWCGASIIFGNAFCIIAWAMEARAVESVFRWNKLDKSRWRYSGTYSKFCWVVSMLLDDEYSSLFTSICLVSFRMIFAAAIMISLFRCSSFASSPDFPLKSCSIEDAVSIKVKTFEFPLDLPEDIKILSPKCSCKHVWIHLVVYGSKVNDMDVWESNISSNSSWKKIRNSNLKKKKKRFQLV